MGVPGCYLEYCSSKLPPTVGVAAQNCYKADKGAFTGEPRLISKKNWL